MAEWLALTKFGKFCVARSGFVTIRGSDATFRDNEVRLNMGKVTLTWNDFITKGCWLLTYKAGHHVFPLPMTCVHMV